MGGERHGWKKNPAALDTSSSYLVCGSMAGCEATTALLPRSGVQGKDESWGMVIPTEVREDEPGGGEKLRILVSEDTAHQISTDPWYQVGFVLTTGINSSYVLGYSQSIMVPLGWIFGSAGLLLAAAISLYANSLVARLHEVGGRGGATVGALGACAPTGPPESEEELHSGRRPRKCGRAQGRT